MYIAGVEVPELTSNELHALEASKSWLEWSSACTAIKDVRGGMYPPNWHEKVVRSGLIRRVLVRRSGG